MTLSKSNTFENDLLKKTFLNTEFAWLPADNVYAGLHTADPGDAGDQTTSECAYTSYARVAVARSGVGWTIVGNQATNAAKIEFPTCTGGTETATHFSIGLTASGAGQILYSGELAAPLSIANNVRPEFAASALTVTEE
jgi:hypothetical protein